MSVPYSRAAESSARGLVLAGCLTALIIPLSIASPAVAIPAIRAALGGSPAELSWMINAYLLTYGSTTLVAGGLADLYGRRRIWILGALLFAIVTGLIPLMPDVAWMNGMRLLQGMAAAAAFAGAMASLAQVFDGQARARVFSLIGTTFGAGAAGGPLLAGGLIDGLGWEWVFFLPALLAALTVPLIAVTSVESKNSGSPRLDWLGAATFTLSLGSLTYAMIVLPEFGGLHPQTLVPLLLSVVLLAAFIAVERSHRTPLLDLELLRNRRFVGVQILAVAPAFCYVVLLVMLPAGFIGVEGLRPTEAGLAMAALSGPLLVVPLASGYLLRWIPARALCCAGLLIAAAGLAWLAQVFESPPQRWMPMLAIGIGIGLPWGIMDGLAVSVVGKEQAGMAAGIFNAMRLAGDAIALAVVGIMLSAGISRSMMLEVGHVARATSHKLSMGDLAGVAQELPGVSRTVLAQAYLGAVHSQLLILAAATVISALVLWYLLRDEVEPTPGRCSQ
ncbi:MFS transporter [Stenotrophomonas maltophilia]|uniref:Major facilitator superfamily MFS_1 n=1 Tax=Stenotrophomonas maltophilia (strain R551-3) TaxID=391008 RepID=B4STJ2_STRM5|nr:MFS transporter [Stenotrophomonas maltophilia]ACF51416.1 major facilitator superfamily MFS_1 [Stenotrophomonas maltophilia R551-3]